MGDWYEDLPNEILATPIEDEAERWVSQGNAFSGKARSETPNPSLMRPFAGFEVLDFGLGPSPVPTDYYAELT